MKFFGMEAKKLARWLALIFTGSALICCLALWASGLPRSIRQGQEWPTVSDGKNYSSQFDGHQVFSAGDVKDLTIRMGFEDVRIIAVQGNEISVRYYGGAEYSLPRREADFDADSIFTSVQEGHRLVLSSDWRGLSVGATDLMLEIEVPETALDRLEVHCASGEVNIQGLVLDDLNATVVSGGLQIHQVTGFRIDADSSSADIVLTDVEAQNLTVQVVSGDLTLDTINADTLDLSSSSGTINGSNMTFENLRGKSVSGRSFLKTISGDVLYRSSSGSVTLEFLQPGERIEVKTVSGDITVALPQGSDFSLNARVVSGEVSCDFPVTVSGDIVMRSLSGSVGEASSRTVVLEASSGDIGIRSR